jgi:hypothetical protein
MKKVRVKLNQFKSQKDSVSFSYKWHVDNKLTSYKFTSSQVHKFTSNKFTNNKFTSNK